jgi:hypothetical protein
MVEWFPSIPSVEFGRDGRRWWLLLVVVDGGMRGRVVGRGERRWRVGGLVWEVLLL